MALVILVHYAFDHLFTIDSYYNTDFGSRYAHISFYLTPFYSSVSHDYEADQEVFDNENGNILLVPF